MTVIFICLHIFMLAVLILAIAWRHTSVEKNRLYEAASCILDDILRGRKVTLPELKEGEIYVLYTKAARVQENLMLEVEKAEEEKKQVKMLVSNMSHQLKTPLANIMLYEDLLIGKKYHTQEEQEKFLRQMRMQAEKLDWILNSLFKMVKLEQDTIEFTTGAFSIKNTLIAALSDVYEKALKKNISLVMTEFDDMELIHNPQWTQEAFANILENAVKYAPSESSVTIDCQTYDMYSVIQIKDTGIGIPKADQQKIFFRFYRGVNAKEQEGSGIGLYLSRLIIEKENGYITVESTPGQGSCFRVFLQNADSCKRAVGRGSA